MIDNMHYVLDTNVLLRLFNRDDQNFDLATNAIRRLTKQKIKFFFTTQAIREFWNVSTRPLKYNGFVLSIEKTNKYVRDIEATMRLLSELPEIYPIWRHLIIVHEVCGSQVHDAYLAATLEAHGVTHLLTFNGGDFKRFTNITPVHPAEVEA